jgi:sporulation protein YlmC with PRC-barrel domain
MISIGADVNGIDGKLGEVSRVIVSNDEITNIVVKKGTFNPGEYVVPLSDFAAGEGTALSLRLTEEQLEQCEMLQKSAYRQPDPDYTGPPGFDARAAGQANLSLDAYVLMGPSTTLGAGQPVFGFPGGERRPPHNLAWATISAGAGIFDSEGEKVGEVDDFTLDAEGGVLERLVLRSGFLGRKKHEVPLDWVQGLEDQRIVLAVDKRQVEALDKGA